MYTKREVLYSQPFLHSSIVFNKILFLLKKKQSEDASIHGAGLSQTRRSITMGNMEHVLAKFGWHVDELFILMLFKVGLSNPKPIAVMYLAVFEIACLEAQNSRKRAKALLKSLVRQRLMRASG